MSATRGQQLEAPRAWSQPMLVVYPHGMRAAFDPRGRFFHPGDTLNGYVVDRLEREGDRVLAHLRTRP